MDYPGHDSIGDSNSTNRIINNYIYYACVYYYWRSLTLEIINMTKTTIQIRIGLETINMTKTTIQISTELRERLYIHKGCGKTYDSFLKELLDNIEEE